MQTFRMVALVAAVVLLGQGRGLAGTTRTVGPGAGYDYSAIQAAIDAAGSGDTIDVYDGTYAEDIAITGLNGLTIQAAAGNAPRLDSTSRNFSITNSSNLLIQGLQTYSTSEGITLYGDSDDVTIRDLTVLETWDDWLEIEGTSDRTTVQNCIIYETGAEALQPEVGTGHVFRDNKFYDTYRVMLTNSTTSDITFEDNIAAWGMPRKPSESREPMA